MSQDFWRLPKGVDEVLPPRARHLELLRRRMLDLFDVWGYDYIEPPIIEYLDALLVGNDLNLQTLQVADQVSGRTLGVRADITSQAARIDANSLSSAHSSKEKAHSSKQNADTASAGDHSTRRLCYAGPVVRANPKGVLESRVPLKAGAEIYGCASLAADLEIMCLAIDALQHAGVSNVVIELGHVGLVRLLVDELDFSESAKSRLFEAVRIKSEADILAIFVTESSGLDGSRTDAYSVASRRLCELVRLMGDGSCLERARSLFKGAEVGALEPGLLELVDQLDYCAARLGEMRPEAVVRFDLSAPVGYGYHHALVYALYDPGHGRAIARGGRYDGIGEQFGDARPATGFDVNLKTLLALPAVARLAGETETSRSIWVAKNAASETQPELAEAIADLRTQGIRVVQGLGEDDVRPADCEGELRYIDDQWQIA